MRLLVFLFFLGLVLFGRNVFFLFVLLAVLGDVVALFRGRQRRQGLLDPEPATHDQDSQHDKENEVLILHGYGGVRRWR